MYKFFLISIILLSICSCNDKDKLNEISTHKIKDITLYQINCSDGVYFSLQKGSCNKLPSSYFMPKGDSENFYSLFVRIKKNELEIYSPYNDIIKSGNIDRQVKLIEYKNYLDNVFVQDSLVGKTYVISGTSQL